MKQEFKQYNKIKSSVQFIKNSVEEEKKNLKSNNAPKELQNKVNEFYDFLKSYDVELLRPKANVLKGDLFDFESVKEKIINHTGYIWKVKEIKSKTELEERGISKEDFEFRHNFTPENYRCFQFYRDSKSRDELWLLVLILLPGCAIIEYSTGRVDGITDICDSIEKLMKDFERCCG